MNPKHTRLIGPGARDGVVLVIVMALVAALVLMGGVAYTVLRTDLRGTGHYADAVSALHQADAGASHVFERIRADLDADVLRFDAPFKTVSYAAPADYSFDTVTNIFALAGNQHYRFSVHGFSRQARATVETVVGGRVSGPGKHVYGDDEVAMGPGTDVYSYSSSTNEWPVPSDSTDHATVASNEDIGGKADAVNGTVVLGEDESGVPATYAHEFSPGPKTDVVRVDRMDPDPLGAIDGPLADEFARVATNNNNGDAVGGAPNSPYLTLEGDVTLTAGDYYVDEINIANNKTLTIDASSGPINVYLTGPAFVAVQGDMPVAPHLPDNFRLFSNSSETIEMKPKTDFCGLIYAPLAAVYLAPNGDIYGGVWARSLEIKPGGAFYGDDDLLHKAVFGFLRIVSWKEVR